MDDSSLRVTRANRVAQCPHRERRLHPFIGGVADDAIGVEVLDRANVELAGIRVVLGDVSQPHLVGTSGREVTLRQVVVNGRSGAFGATDALGERAEDLLLGADPPHTSFARDEAGAFELVDDEPVTKDRIVVVRVDCGVGQVGVLVVALRDRTRQPLVVTLGRELEDPTRHRDGEKSAPSSRTSGYFILGWGPWRSRWLLDAGSRSPIRAVECTSSMPSARRTRSR